MVFMHVPTVLRDVSRWDANIQLTRQDALDLFPTLVCLMFVPCRHASMLLLLDDFRCCHAQHDPGRCDSRSKIFRRSSRRIVQPPGVDDLCRLSSGLLLHDLRHFQLFNVRKLLDLSLTYHL